MFNVSQSLLVDRSVAEVWPYLIAFEQVPSWEHGVLEVRQLTPGAPRLGTEISARRIYAGRVTQLTGRIVAFEDGRSATMSLRGGPLAEVFAEYAVERIDDHRSLVIYRGYGDLIRPLRFLHPFVPAAGRAETRKSLARLKERIEADIPPSSQTPLPRSA